jgi:hypothetical protein
MLYKQYNNDSKKGKLFRRRQSIAIDILINNMAQVK